MGISDPVLWSFAQLKKNPSAVIDAIIFFLSKHNLTLGVERLYRFIDERTFRQKQLVSVTMAVKKQAGFLWRPLWSTRAGGVGHGSRDSIRPIKCRFSRSNGGHIFRCELRIGCRFSTDFCARHENQTNIFWELLVQYLGQLFGNSQWQVSIFCINFSQWKSYYVENVCLSSMLDMDILSVVCGTYVQD